MIIESSMIVGLGLAVTFMKCSWRVKMKMLSNPVAMDLGVFIFLLVIHWGSFYGVMAATGGALMCSVLITCGRALFGHIKGNYYFPGFFDITNKLITTTIRGANDHR